MYKNIKNDMYLTNTDVNEIKQIINELKDKKSL